MKKTYPLSARLTALIMAVVTAVLSASAGAPPFAIESPALPSIPDFTISMTDLGASGDGVTDHTDTFAKAMARLREHGGGRLTVPAGVWLTGPVRLESHVDLHLEEGALIVSSPDRNDYPLIRRDIEGHVARECISPLSATDKHDIAITGRGVINGNGQAWRPVKKDKLTASQWERLCASGGVTDTNGRIWYPSASARDFTPARIGAIPADCDSMWAQAHDALRPVMVSLVRCQRVLLEGVTFENSPRWNLHPLLCTDLTIRDVTVRNPYFAQNGDGLDVESCRRVEVTGCTFDVGDDAICLKSGRDEGGRRRGVPTEDVMIADCKVYHGHGGFVIGSEMSGNVSRVAVRNCTFIGTDTGIKFKTTRGRGGCVSDIDIEGLSMIDLPGDAITIDMYYGLKGKEGETRPADETTPRIERVAIRSAMCRGADCAIHIKGLPEMPVMGVTVENSTFSSRRGAVLDYADRIEFNNVTLLPDDGQRVTKGRNVGLTDNQRRP